jgi:hypothetical protein
MVLPNANNRHGLACNEGAEVLHGLFLPSLLKHFSREYLEECKTVSIWGGIAATDLNAG